MNVTQIPTCVCCGAPATLAMVVPTDATTAPVGARYCDKCAAASAADFGPLPKAEPSMAWELPIDALIQIPPEELPYLTRGTTIGYVFTGPEFVQVWRRGEVVANDPDAGIVVVETRGAWDLDTFEYGTDWLARWPAEVV